MTDKFEWIAVKSVDELHKVIREKGIVKEYKYIDDVLHIAYKESLKDEENLDKYADIINGLLDIKNSYQAPQKIMDILTGDIKERHKVFNNFLETFDKDLDWDWFQKYFESEHADRKKKKQDYTPNSVSRILSGLVEDTNNYYEVCAGTGGIMIQRWSQDRYKHSPFEYKPSMNFYIVEELDDRAFLFLLFNMLIRGMNGIAIKCDVLTRESEAVYFIQNDDDDYTNFSKLNLMPYNEMIEKEFNIKFVEDVRHKEVKQSRKVDWLLKLESEDIK
ncbi:N-6 DNA methylase [Macrococcus sp. EM39E]|uniref:N-6 DNA methylase n=1 Tax=Macrococcus animalis TaxID=3395467 RepID=UPI0039BE6DED